MMLCGPVQGWWRIHNTPPRMIGEAIQDLPSDKILYAICNHTTLFSLMVLFKSHSNENMLICIFKDHHQQNCVQKIVRLLYIISIGSLSFLSNIKKKGKQPVLGCTLALYAMQTDLKWDSYVCGCTSAMVDNILRKLQLEFSTCGVVLDSFQVCSQHFSIQGFKIQQILAQHRHKFTTWETIGHHI